MRHLKQIFVLAAAIAGLVCMHEAAALEAPDELVKRVSQEVFDLARADPEIQAGNTTRVQALVEARILPHVDFQRMTALAAGRNWRKATPDQQQRLTTEFRDLLTHVYAGAISQIRDQEIMFKRMRGSPADTRVEVRSVVVQSGGAPIQLNYRLEKHADGWKIYDINILGAWLVQTYRSSFAAQIRKGGIDGLIKTLSDKNQRMASAS
ncbi:MAG: ABC transporter substrate-binding protein [Herminiimonas sp.]|nr:ABC transporter substrate-binding protein [Herminiimonas sp.]